MRPPAEGLLSGLASEGHRDAPVGVDDVPLRRLLAAELAALAADPVESRRSRETLAA